MSNTVEGLLEVDERTEGFLIVPLAHPEQIMQGEDMTHTGASGTETILLVHQNVISLQKAPTLSATSFEYSLATTGSRLMPR